ncbi:MAG: hypothetical protein UX10_C0028G0016 [Candidatus Magasanikbacteria bacterium GW2011_GWA2_45_39]|uniref:Uncharacterized protein n=1 Tax=Candidatus Magasanikbacteria bacterium GW2011_GWA2_45_39 TaxID=1619041 RepID=A0A0G1PMI5_9BACT|nr:MAG: hypothetical protein UX10_C0028G0016 [Candidatus Magasanikbacteria bacterium GW2011_GWA2_45_39]
MFKSDLEIPLAISSRIFLSQGEITNVWVSGAEMAANSWRVKVEP